MSIAWTLPFDLVIPMLLAGGLGYLIDRWRHTSPLFILILGFLGFGIGLRNVLKAASLLDKKDDS